MPAWGWVLVVLVVLAVLGIVAWQASAKRRTSHLQERFGPEYDRVAGDAESRREAESELSEREERRDELDIRPLPDASRARYVESWKGVQSQFVDDPRGALAAADALLQQVMSERGYPVEDFEQQAAVISVDHPHVVENYREGHRLAETSDSDGAATEDLRQAMQHYRSLFEELVESSSEPSAA